MRFAADSVRPELDETSDNNHHHGFIEHDYQTDVVTGRHPGLCRLVDMPAAATGRRG